MTTRPAKPTVRYSAIKSARTVGSANVELHHHGGRDPNTELSTVCESCKSGD